MFLKTQHIGAVIRAFQGAAAAGVAFVSQSLAIGCRGITVVGTIRCTAGGVPQTRTFLILAYGTAWTAGVFSQVRAGLTIVVHGACSRQTSLCVGFPTHGATVHKTVTGIGFYLIMFLAVTAETAFAVLYIALGDTGVVIALTSVATGTVQTVIRTSVGAELLAGAAFVNITGIKFLTGALGVFFTRGVFPVTSFTDAVIRNFAGDVITRTGRNTFFEIRAVVGTGVGRFLSFGTGGLSIPLLTAALGIV